MTVPALSQNCEPTSPTRRILEQLQTPPNAHLPAVQRQLIQLELLRHALSAAPGDVALHEAYQSVRLSGLDIDRPALIAEYAQLLARHPHDQVFLYLAAKAQAGQQTKEAIVNLQSAIELAPDFGLSHLLLAEIDSSAAYADTAGVKQHMQRFAALCPASLRTLPALRWSDDKDLLRKEAGRLRGNLAGRTDSDAATAYFNLWLLERALERSDHQAENLARMQSDLDRLFSADFARNEAWLATIQGTQFFDGAPKGVGHKALEQVAALYPDSNTAAHLQYERTVAGLIGPYKAAPEGSSASWRSNWQALLPVLRQWPNSPWLAELAQRAVLKDQSASPKEIKDVMTAFLRAFEGDPEGYRTLPPLPISVAQSLVDRGGPFETVPELARAGLAVSERELAENDLSGMTGANLIRYCGIFSTLAYLPLAEAELRMGQVSSANETLVKAEAALAALRPEAGAQDKSGYGGLAAQYWFLRGQIAVKEGRKVDGLVDYRNALSLYPLRTPRGDRRDEVMAAAKKLWNEIGVTAQGWNDWAAQSSLAGFYGGSDGSEAWAKLAMSSPDLILTDALGNHWKPSDLAKKTTFVAVWASWCAPCCAELPYLEKLYEQFKGRDDIAILALNVDDDPKAMIKALAKFNVKIPSVAAVDFAYSIVPEQALPANWIITPRKTEMFNVDAENHDAWLEGAAKAIEAAARSNAPTLTPRI
jgi:thiol-disulfide isomerase/thioredoxin